MTNPEENPVISRQVLEMITVAHEYCLFFEEAEKYPAQEIFAYFQKIGPLLYLKGAILPTGIKAEPEYMERFVTEEQWEGIFKSLREKFGEEDVYYVHNHNYDTEEVSLADNLADIYQDMKDFVMLYQKAPITSKECAVAELQKLFENHWGLRVLQALGYVHGKIYRDSIDPELFSDEDLSD